MPRPATIAQRQLLVAQRPPEPPMVPERPGYAADFAEGLAYQLAHATPQQVPALIHAHFPAPDQLDCTYLAGVLQTIDEARYCEREVGCGTDFVFWGIEYSAPNVAAARIWLENTRVRLA
ncbi:hypothetical protein D0N36_18990 [Hymenobacter lapidiphilus]|uniref:hypothetical protein n=1 Tax=Hymenobacter sp. CCM 8763 TaxID=2303334 RepID=UPI000E34242A|nr:hypothetical protein [Hymenobacter sp. CCM 8763]RFP63518.1 hypothetical protein D0N36_18990 [Hymenobacter sp. CCM 8763]